MIALALWLVASVLAGLLAGRFIRTGMVDQVRVVASDGRLREDVA